MKFEIMIVMKTFGEKLRELRNEKGMTQKELAEKLLVRNTTVSAWEKDIAEPPYETLRQIVMLFQMSADYFLGLEEEDGTKKY